MDHDNTQFTPFYPGWGRPIEGPDLSAAAWQSAGMNGSHSSTNSMPPRPTAQPPHPGALVARELAHEALAADRKPSSRSAVATYFRAFPSKLLSISIRITALFRAPPHALPRAPLGLAWTSFHRHRRRSVRRLPANGCGRRRHRSGRLGDIAVPEVDDTGFGPIAFCSKDRPTHPQEILENMIDYTYLREPRGMDVLKTGSLEVEGPYLRMNLSVRAATLPVLGDIVATQPSQMAGLGWNLAELTLPNSNVTIRTWGLPNPIGPWRTRLNIATACAPALSTRLPSRLRPPVAARWCPESSPPRSRA
jgi:hypothetical protein